MACHVAGFKVACQYSGPRLAILVGCHRRLYCSENLNEESQNFNGVNKSRARKMQRSVNSPSSQLGI